MTTQPISKLISGNLIWTQRHPLQIGASGLEEGKPISTGKTKGRRRS